MAYLLDTNIAIHLQDGNDAVLSNFLKHSGRVYLSALSLVELERGIYADAENTSVRQDRLAALLRELPVLPFGRAAAHAYGAIVAKVGLSKRRDYDRMIAAHAIAAGLTLVTNNQADFKDVPGLVLENWI